MFKLESLKNDIHSYLTYRIDKILHGDVVNTILRFCVTLLVLFVIYIVVIAAKDIPTGFRGKTLWQWLDIFLSPLIIAITGWILTVRLKQIEQQQDIFRGQQEDLQAYFDRMSNLLLNHDLRKSSTDNEGVIICQNLTSVITATASNKQKRQILQFLYSSGLIYRKSVNNFSPLINLKGANFDNVFLEGINLPLCYLHSISLKYTNLQKANLSKINLENARLEGINLSASILQEANLKSSFLNKAKLYGASLIDTDFRRADLTSANFKKADLHNADFRNTTLTNASFDEATLRNVDFRQANLSKIKFKNTSLFNVNFENVRFKKDNVNVEQLISQLQKCLKHAKEIENIILPNGQLYSRPAPNTHWKKWFTFDRRS